ncbi:MAG: SWIM zinc finger family protein [Candidatus Eisenbacteria sp.]|nr:SWIM zinc finger family protein [Candidatus Eisenbacteria bacterium]
MSRYISPSIETLAKYELFPFVRRALGLILAVEEIGHNVWSVNNRCIVQWDGAGFVCDCTNWQLHGGAQGGYCKHSLAVCLRSDSYRARVNEALQEACHV